MGAQHPPVQLAARQVRELRPRDHVVGQPGRREEGGNGLAHAFDLRRHECGQAPPAALAHELDRGLAHTGHPAEGSLHLARFHALTAQLDLAVPSAEVVQAAVLSPAHHVARGVPAQRPAVGFLPDREGVPVGGGVRHPVVAVGDGGAAEVQLPGGTRGDPATVPVEHPGDGPGVRAADRQGPAGGDVGLRHDGRGAGHHGLGRPVDVEEERARDRGVVERRQGRRHDVAPDAQPPEGVQGAGPRHAQHRLVEAGHEEGVGHPVARDQRDQGHRVGRLLVRREHQAPPVARAQKA